MDTHALFDRMASELAASGAVEDTGAPIRTLVLDGTPFARLADGGAEVYLPEGSPARADAVGRPSTTPAENGWLFVPDSDVTSWPALFEQALHGLQR